MGRQFWNLYAVLMSVLIVLQLCFRLLTDIGAWLSLMLNFVNLAVILGFPIVYLFKLVLLSWDEPAETEPILQHLPPAGPKPIITIIRGGSSSK
jgi:hypothetical protein